MTTDAVREQMVEQQVRTWDVFDARVLNAIRTVPRDRYVPARFRDCAYADAEVPLDHGQCMLRPSIDGRILQALDIGADDEVLEIGTGTGYLTHCLAMLGGHVTSIDLYANFVDDAARRLDEDGVGNVSLAHMDASTELPPGHFDAIAMTCAVEAAVDRYTAALKPGGRLFVVIGKSPVMTATRMTRREDGVLEEADLFETNIPAMVTADRHPVFSF